MLGLRKNYNSKFSNKKLKDIISKKIKTHIVTTTNIGLARGWTGPLEFATGNVIKFISKNLTNQWDTNLLQVNMERYKYVLNYVMI